jgi:hypothetical protein
VGERKGGKKNRKFGRNRAKCEAYRLAGRREANKVRRIVRDARRARDPLAVLIFDAYRDRVGATLRDRPLSRPAPDGILVGDPWASTTQVGA